MYEEYIFSNIAYNTKKMQKVYHFHKLKPFCHEWPLVFKSSYKTHCSEHFIDTLQTNILISEIEGELPRDLLPVIRFQTTIQDKVMLVNTETNFWIMLGSTFLLYIENIDMIIIGMGTSGTG